MEFSNSVWQASCLVKPCLVAVSSCVVMCRKMILLPSVLQGGRVSSILHHCDDIHHAVREDWVCWILLHHLTSTHFSDCVLRQTWRPCLQGGVKSQSCCPAYLAQSCHAIHRSCWQNRANSNLEKQRVPEGVISIVFNTLKTQHNWSLGPVPVSSWCLFLVPYSCFWSAALNPPVSTLVQWVRRQNKAK